MVAVALLGDGTARSDAAEMLSCASRCRQLLQPAALTAAQRAEARESACSHTGAAPGVSAMRSLSLRLVLAERIRVGQKHSTWKLFTDASDKKLTS